MQTSLFTDLFSGETYIPKFDKVRLTGQWERVSGVMSDSKWRTLSEIQRAIHALHGKHDSEAAISARLRDFRKPKFGSRTVNRRRRGEESRGLFEYQIV